MFYSGGAFPIEMYPLLLLVGGLSAAGILAFHLFLKVRETKIKPRTDEKRKTSDRRSAKSRQKTRNKRRHL